MDKEKRIDEMAEDIYNALPEYEHNARSCRNAAEEMYAKGYRKQRVGEWKYPPYAPFGGSYEMRQCSVCGYKPDFDSDNPYTKFCPNCGARMKGESND